MFRSEKMSLCQIFLPPEVAYTSVSELGEAGCVQFRDLNRFVNLFQRYFVNEIRRCSELERKIRYIESETIKDGIDLMQIDADEIPTAPNNRETSELESQLETIEREIHEMSDNVDDLRTNYSNLIEYRMVLLTIESFVPYPEIIPTDLYTRYSVLDQYNPAKEENEKGLIAGIVKQSKFFAFEQMLFRITRGNMFLKRSNVDENDSNQSPIPIDFNEKRTVFIVFFHGNESKNLIIKVCVSFHVKMYPCPLSIQELGTATKGVLERLHVLKLVLDESKSFRKATLTDVSKHLWKWKIMIKKRKAVYHTLNFFSINVTRKCLIAECWVPINDLALVRKALANGSAAVGSSIPSPLNIIDSNEAPPTYNRTNKFTRGFQNLIDAYGISSYREANPALYTIITFPFLFAVMFGDLGHGFILTLFGGWMVIWEKKLERKQGGGEIWRIFFGGRYIILLMGLFAMYTGIIYNDLFSKSLNIFGPTWRIKYNTSTVMENKKLQLMPDVATEGVYPIGLDPIWQMAENKIMFLNTYKMKLSIIIGVFHMVFGVCMSVVNYTHFKKMHCIILEFVPQILFLLLLFGYMVFLMFFKWIKYSATSPRQPETPGCAPSVLIMFINMMLFKHTEPLPGCEEFMFKSQPVLQTTFLLIALICIPWMLLGKPLYYQLTNQVLQEDKIKRKKSQHKRKSKKSSKKNGAIPLPMEHKTDIDNEDATDNPFGRNPGSFANTQNNREINLSISSNTGDTVRDSSQSGSFTERTSRASSHITTDQAKFSESPEPFRRSRQNPFANYDIFENISDSELSTILDSEKFYEKSRRKTQLIPEEQKETVSEIYIHQTIFTIEYALSTISHTASYLRLWALSLAHAQLSEVLWNMVLAMGLKTTSRFAPIILYFVFAAWSLFTLAILVMMEGLSAFLHTLRLHWVEFMSKFYHGVGTAFQPFSFKSILDDG